MWDVLSCYIKTILYICNNLGIISRYKCFLKKYDSLLKENIKLTKKLNIILYLLDLSRVFLFNLNYCSETRAHLSRFLTRPGLRSRTSLQ